MENTQRVKHERLVDKCSLCCCQQLTAVREVEEAAGLVDAAHSRPAVAQGNAVKRLSSDGMGKQRDVLTAPPGRAGF